MMLGAATCGCCMGCWGGRGGGGGICDTTLAAWVSGPCPELLLGRADCDPNKLGREVDGGPDRSSSRIRPDMTYCKGVSCLIATIHNSQFGRTRF